jgi:hypothetical protein
VECRAAWAVWAAWECKVRPSSFIKNKSGFDNIRRSRSSLFKLEDKNVCQLEGSDHGGRDSAAELALAGVGFSNVE